MSHPRKLRVEKKLPMRISQISGTLGKLSGSRLCQGLHHVASLKGQYFCRFTWWKQVFASRSLVPWQQTERCAHD